MSFPMSTLTWDCIKLQNLIETSSISEAEKNDLIDRHLTTLHDSGTLTFPEFDFGTVDSFQAMHRNL